MSTPDPAAGAVYDRGYRKRQALAGWSAGCRFLEGDLPDGQVGIHLIGVWDTVGSLGVPDDLVLLDQLLDQPRKYRFHDTELSARVRHGRHALAIDEIGETPDEREDGDIPEQEAADDRGGALEVLDAEADALHHLRQGCLLYTSPSPRDGLLSRMPSSA